MPTLRQRGNEAKDPDLLLRVQAGCMQVADEVMAETPATPTETDLKRRRLAKLILGNPAALAVPMAQRISAHENFGSDPGNPTGNDPATDSDSGDGALLYIMREFWNEYAENL